jgi:cytochrome c551/c552
MRRIAKPAVGFALAGAAVFSMAWLMAAPVAIKLPAETVKLRASTLPGFASATQKCGICHSADYINYQPPGMNQTQWTAEVAKMQHGYGAPISDEDVKQIGAYLAVAYGTAKATDDAVIAVSALAGTAPVPAAPASTTPARSDSAVDAQSLLAANACLSCHAVDRKLVGPAYHDVALKYKGDDGALTKVEASIRAGGMGRWGQVPMPPFPGLSEAQLKALAEFVLQQ